MAFVTDILTPIVKVVLIGGFAGTILFFIIKAFYNAWSKSLKFFLRYKIFRKKIPDHISEWCMECLADGVGWYDAKKLLMVHGTKKKEINEILWVYDQIIIQLKGGKDKNGRKFEGIGGKTERKTSKYPEFTTK